MKVTLPEHEQKKVEEVKWFEVNPKMDRTSFKETREDAKQEATRLIICEAFEEVDAHPEKYAEVFETLEPLKPKEWEWKEVQLKKVVGSAGNWGGEIGNWVEQALQWAQRINNGESWEKLCNESDIAKFFRVVIWKEGEARLVGGCTKVYRRQPATHVSPEYPLRCLVHVTVPFVVRRKKTV